MPRRSARPQPDRTLELPAHTRACPACGRAALGGQQGPADRRRPWRASSGCGSRSAAAATPTAPATGPASAPSRRGASPCRSTSSASTSSPWSAASATPSTAASRRSTPSWSAAACRSASAASATSWTATTSCWPCRAPDAGRLRRDHGRGRAGDPGHRRPAAGRRPRGPLGDPRRALAARSCWPGACCPRRQDDLAKLLGEVKAALAGADRRGGLRRPDLDPQGGGRGPRRRAPPALPLPLPPRGGHAGLRGRPPRQGPAQEEGPRHPADRAEGRGPARTPRPRRSGATARRSARR